MEDNEKECLERKSIDFLISAAIGRKKFSEEFKNADSDIKEFLLTKGYVAGERITALGRTYAAYHYDERIISLVPSHS